MKNKNMLRILALIFALIIALSAISCTDEGDASKATPSETETSTDHVTETPTDIPTKVPTEKPTEKLTEAPTSNPTEDPTELPTEVPTDTPTEAPTDTPTEAPTDKSTEAPSEKPSETPDIIPIENPALTMPSFTAPQHDGSAYVDVNDGVPFFTQNQIVSESYEYYSPLDDLGRCGITVACLGKDLMPTDDRGNIGHITPTGWQSGTIYDRCHLIGWQLAGENANKQNLVTGTKELNRAMLEFENMIADYIKETGNHVMYRVTPVFDGNNLLCSGVLIEAYSVEDEGEGICFNVYIHNVQSHYDIDYSTGEFEFSLADVTYIINKGNFKVHKTTCSSASKLKEENRIYYYGTLEELMEEYPDANTCGICKP